MAIGLLAAAIAPGRRLFNMAVMKPRNRSFMGPAEFVIGSRARCSSNLSLRMLM